MESVYDFLLNEVKIVSGDSLVIAVSGGPDSMALLHQVKELSKKINIKIICAHVNHNTGRPGQILDEEFVKEWCNKNDIILEHMTIKEYRKANFHSEAHKIRYSYFEEIIEKYKARYLLTAHHGDDLMETILMRIVRGSTLKGYAGFERIIDMGKYKILRPLINETKENLVKYNLENNVLFREDDSNKKDVYTRNRYRKYILPELKKEDENVHKKFSKFSQTLLMYEEYVNKEAKTKYAKTYSNNKLNIEDFLKEERIIQLKILNYILEDKYKDNLYLIHDKHIDLIYNLINSVKSNTNIMLPNNIIVKKEYNYLIFDKKNEINSYEYELNKKIVLPNNKIIEEISDTSLKSNYICRLNKKDLVLPLKVRTRKSGDKMVVKGINKAKKLSDIFINEKISLEDRNSCPIVVDSENKIIWLPGIKKSIYDVPINEKCDIILKYN